jgi:hypothetical protein
MKKGSLNHQEHQGHQGRRKNSFVLQHFYFILSFAFLGVLGELRGENGFGFRFLVLLKKEHGNGRA